jgi:hypothetical protein
MRLSGVAAFGPFAPTAQRLHLEMRGKQPTRGNQKPFHHMFHNKNPRYLQRSRGKYGIIPIFKQVPGAPEKSLAAEIKNPFRPSFWRKNLRD